MRRSTTITVLILGAFVGLCLASASQGKVVARWHSSSYEAQFTAKECGRLFEATRTFSSAVKHLKLRQPAVGVSVLDPKGNRVAKVSSVKATHLQGGGWKVVWKATPGLVCPKEPPEPMTTWCSSFSEGRFVPPAEVEECERKRKEEERHWEEEVAAQQQEAKEFRATWGRSYEYIKEYPYARTRPVHFAYKFFTRRNVVHHPAPAPGPCLLVCEAKHALFRSLKAHYEMTTTSASCHQLTARKVHCYFQGLTSADVREGNIAGHKGDAYVAKFPGGFDVQVHSFYPA